MRYRVTDRCLQARCVRGARACCVRGARAARARCVRGARAARARCVRCARARCGAANGPGRRKRWRRRRRGRAAAHRDGRGGGRRCRSPIRGGSDLAGGRMASEKIEKIGVSER